MITVKFDHTLDLPNIVMPIYSESAENDPLASSHDTQIIEQSKLDGIMVPLVRINNQTIYYTQILHMELTCSRYPHLELTIDDQLGLIKNLDTPGWDNILQLQILPPFEGGYKKINLLFYMTGVSIEGSIMDISADYHIPNLWDNKIRAYGKITTYDYMEMTAKEFGLGFASNVDSTNDAKYIYKDMKNTISHISEVVDYAYADKDDDKSVFTWWIDYWNNLNFVNLYDEYMEEVPDDKMLIWVQDLIPHPAGDDHSQTVSQMVATLNNSPASDRNAMSIDDYTPIYESMSYTDRIVDTYRMDNMEFETTVIQNGDVMDNIQQKYTYLGEVFGDYNYLARRAAKSMMISKIDAQKILVSISVPTLGRIMGDKINLYWYDINNYITAPIQETKNEEIETNISVPPSVYGDANSWVINKMVSGQYYIENMSFTYDSEFTWTQTFKLSRDGSKKNSYNPPVKEEIEKN